MLGLLSQPKKQSADAAIFTLCDRISHSSLIEDRRAAVLTLRGLAHENRELVASSGLRGLLDVLCKDYSDPVAAKATLETFLVLLNTETRRKVRNKRYVSPLLQAPAQQTTEPNEIVVSDISLWLTDELLQNENALRCVLELTKTSDPFTAVYALQLVSAMVTNRSVQTKLAMIEHGGVSPLVAALGSVQDMVRDEALILLTALTANHLDLQKLVAFESGFEKCFEILTECGGPVFGGRTAEDCLMLLENLIEFNTSNQTLFTETGCVKRWCDVLQSVIDAQSDGAPMREQSVRNIESTLQIGQVLTVPGAERTPENQKILSGNGAITLVLQIAFGHSTLPQIRVSALMTVAAMINSNSHLQADFLSMDVPYYPLQNASVSEPKTIPVAQALLNWMVSLASTHLFDLRVAALECLTSSFTNNPSAKFAFIQDQIDGYSQNLDSIDDANLISVVSEFNEDNLLNPFRVWLTCALVMRLFLQSPESKDQLRKVKIGDESLGMDVHTLVQAISGELQLALTQQDPTLALGYLQLLTVWLYDDLEAVNEFTQESSVIQALLAHQSPDPLVESLSVIVLGTAYAFCTKESPVPRARFHKLLTTTLGRDQYMLLVRKFRQSAIFQNFDATDMFGAPKTTNGNPAVYVDIPFVELMRESIGYISRAIHANPDIEPSSKVTLEMLDDVKSVLHQKTVTLETVEGELVEANRKITDLEKELVKSQTDTSKFDSQKQEYEKQISDLRADLSVVRPKLEACEKELEKVKAEGKESNDKFNDLKKKFDEQAQKLDALKAAKDKIETGVNNMTREIFQMQRSREQLEKEHNQVKSESQKSKAELSTTKQKLDVSVKSESSLQTKLQDLQKRISQETEQHTQLKQINDKLVAKLKETAADLKDREEEEEELKEQLKEVKIKAEDASNEVITLTNQRAQHRKELELAKAKIDSLKRQVESSADTQNKLKTVEADKSTLEERLKLIEAEKNEIKNNVSSSEEQIKALTEKLQTAENQIKSGEERLKLIEAEKNEVKGNVKSSEEQIKALTEKLQTAENQIKTNEERLKQVEAEKNEVEGNVKSSEEHLKGITEKLHAAENQVKVSEDQLSATEKKLTNLESQIKSAEERADSVGKTAKQEIDAIQETLKSQKKASELAIQAKEKVSVNQQIEIKESKQKLTDLEKKLKQLQEESSSNGLELDSKLKTAESKAAAAELKLKEAEQKLITTKSDTDSKLSSADERIKELETKLTNTEKQMESNGVDLTRIKSAEEEVKSFKEKLKAAEGNLKATSDLSESKIKAAEEKAQTAEQKLKALEDQANTTNKEVKSLTTKLKSLEEKEKAAEKEKHATAEKLKSFEEKSIAAEESKSIADKQLKSLEDKVKASEAQTKSVEEKLQSLESKSKAAEDRAKVAEEKLKPLEDKAKASEAQTKSVEEKLQSLESKLKAAEDRAKVAEEKLKPLEDKAKAAEDKMKSLEEKCKADIEASKAIELGAKESKEKLESIKKELLAAEDKAASAEKQVQDLSTKYDDSVKSSTLSGAERAKELEDLTKSSDKLKEMNAQLLQQIASLKKNDLKKELDEKKEAIDDLMLLLDDLTEKKAKYKQMLKAKDMEVSESDDDDDDDDEE